MAARGGIESTFAGDLCRDPVMLLPFTVGVIPGVSEDEIDEGEVSGSDDELIELIVFLTAPGAISFRGIDFDVPPESILATGADELEDSNEGRGSASSLSLNSCED